MEAFFIGVLSSIAGALVVLGATAAFSRTFRNVFLAGLARYLHVDVVEVFATQREAAAAVRAEAERSSRLLVLTGRGAELQRETFTKVLNECTAVRILLPSCEPDASGIDWVADRAAELLPVEPNFNAGILGTQIEATATYVRSHARPGVELRRFGGPHLGRIVITDRAAFLTPYRYGLHGRDCPVIQYRAGGDTYQFLERTFEKHWHASSQ